MEIKYKLAEEYSEKEVLKYDLGNQVEVEDFDFLCQTHFIAGYEAATTMINVDVKMPDASIFPCELICANDLGTIEILQFENYTDFVLNVCDYFEITHWLPIPKLPTK